MWSKKFSNIINKIFPQRRSSELYGELSKINPEKFYLENVRSLLGISYDKAEAICNEAVQEGVFLQCFEILCPDGSVAKSVENLNDIPETVECWEDHNGDYEPAEYRTDRLARNPYYRFASLR